MYQLFCGVPITSRDALIVGINRYESGSIQNLKSPAEDAQAIVDLLRKYSDFNVKPFPMVKDKEHDSVKVGLTSRVTVGQLEDELARLFKPDGKSIPDTALFFFSGHGLRKAKGLTEGYLATSDLVSAAAKDGRMVLVIDQFEEAFTLCRDVEARKKFFACLFGALSLVPEKFCPVLTMRADFFGKCAEQNYSGLSDHIQENLVTVPPMTGDELEKVIVNPRNGSDWKSITN